MNKKILVTGGAGYIGSHMVHLLLDNNFEPIVLDNLSNSDISNLKKIEDLHNTKIQLIEHDLKEALTFEIPDTHAIIHFAALKAVGESVQKPVEYYENNVGGTLHLIDWANRNNVKHIIFSSTAAVYGMSGEKPLSESDITKPESPYASSKLFSEQILADAYKAYGISSVALRYFNVAGNLADGLIGDLQKNPQNLIPALIMSDLGLRQDKLKVFGTDYPTRDGTGIRDYVHVLDLVDAHLKALHFVEKETGSHTFNLGTGTGASVLEVINAYEKVSGRKVNYETAQRREGDVIFSTADYRKAKTKLAWEPKHSLDEMVESAYKWYLRQDGK